MSRVTLASPEALEHWQQTRRALEQAYTVQSDLLHRAYMAGLEVTRRRIELDQAEAAVLAAPTVERPANVVRFPGVRP